METDTEIALTAEREGKIILRWYGWKKLSLSFGYSQKELMEKFDSLVPKVLRPTGGGILLHGWDISYAAGIPSGLFRTHLQLYRFFSEIFLKTFESLGISQVTYSRSKKANYRRWKICSLFPTFGEICLGETPGGKKLVASAVREFRKGNYLIHGSIYVAFNYKLGSAILKVPEVVLKNSIATLKELRLGKKELIKEFNKRFLASIGRSG